MSQLFRTLDWKMLALAKLKRWNSSLGFNRPGHCRQKFYPRFVAATIELGNALAGVLDKALKEKYGLK